MKFYELMGNKYYIYTIKPKYDAIMEYKYNRFYNDSIDGNCVYRAVTNWGIPFAGFMPFSENETYTKDGQSFYCKLLRCPSIDESVHSLELVDRYIDGEFKDCSVKKLYDEESVRYFLLTQEYVEFEGESVMEGILEIPEDLYCLQMLEQGKLYNLDLSELNELWNLFDFEIDIIDKDKFVVDDSYKRENHSKVLSKKRIDMMLSSIKKGE